jgi:hypothetical protein
VSSTVRPEYGMNKEHILSEIKRTAAENEGVPLGIDRFREATGIRKEDWYGIFWAKWTDAQIEAGLKPNQFGIPAFDEEWMLDKVAEYTSELGHFPTKPELKLRKQHDTAFPNIVTLRRRLGNKPEMVNKLLEYCRACEGWDDVIDICLKLQSSLSKAVLQSDTSEENVPKIGYVYLIQHGNRREYKIGKTYNLIRREGEIRLELPEKVKPIHTIETDDPSGIEQYWHNRFSEKRKEGEWFELNAGDVRAFKKWKKIL